jgi:hypothetical protein
MEKLKDKMARFMGGRYGMDDLYKASMILCLALLGASALVKSPVVVLLAWVVMTLTMYRSFSRDIGRRSMENEKYLAVRKQCKKSLSLIARKIRGIRTYRYRSCPHCKAVIEMPRRRGTRTINCPRCHTEFETHISI